MKRRNTLPALILLVLLAGCLVAVYVTSEPSTPQPAAVLTTASGQADAVGLQLLETANRMAALAETSWWSEKRMPIPRKPRRIGSASPANMAHAGFPPGLP